MKLLITTQAVDLDDPVLGFFHRWIEELSKRFDTISVICLKEGRHSLPANVSVYSLGKEGGVSRIAYVLNFYRYIWKLRNDYDAVFVHMNQEYVLLGWKFWWLLGKRVVHLTGMTVVGQKTECLITLTGKDDLADQHLPISDIGINQDLEGTLAQLVHHVFGEGQSPVLETQPGVKRVTPVIGIGIRLPRLGGDMLHQLQFGD